VEVKSLYEFIVRPVGGKRYNNTKSIGGIDFIISTSEEDHRYGMYRLEIHYWYTIMLLSSTMI
jgi:hypothetical protein